MNLSDYLKQPMWAAIFAGLITVMYIRLKSQLNNEGMIPTSDYVKPAVLNGLLVLFIVTYGSGSSETISTEPF